MLPPSWIVEEFVEHYNRSGSHPVGKPEERGAGTRIDIAVDVQQGHGPIGLVPVRRDGVREVAHVDDGVFRQITGYYSRVGERSSRSVMLPVLGNAHERIESVYGPTGELLAQ